MHAGCVDGAGSSKMASRCRLSSLRAALAASAPAPLAPAASDTVRAKQKHGNVILWTRPHLLKSFFIACDSR